jgi:heterodisulfide reductase subunit B2
MSIAVYPGCSLNGSSREYMESIRAILDCLDVKADEVEDWNCCGSTAAHNIDPGLALALPSRVLAQAGSKGTDDLLVPCAACYNRLKAVWQDLKSSDAVMQKAAALLDQEIHLPSKIMNILDFIQAALVPILEGKITNPFQKKVACYYGCLLVRPQKLTGEPRVEDPQGMEEIMKQIGATPIDWAFKTECCGAGFTMSQTQTVARLSSAILSDATERGAEAIIVACPMCHSNLDMRRKDIEKYSKRKYTVPVLYITQAIGLALGISHKKLGLQRHFVPVTI